MKLPVLLQAFRSTITQYTKHNALLICFIVKDNLAARAGELLLNAGNNSKYEASPMTGDHEEVRVQTGQSENHFQMKSKGQGKTVRNRRVALYCERHEVVFHSFAIC